MKQISIFLEDKSVRLTEATELIAQAAINIDAASLADSADFGILRLVVNNTEEAARVLKENGYTISINEVVGIEVANKPGGLAGVLKIASDNSLNVEYFYACVAQKKGKAGVIVRFEHPEKGVRVLKKAKIKLLPENKPPK